MSNMGVECEGFGADTLHMARLLDASRTGKRTYGLDNLSADWKVGLCVLSLYVQGCFLCLDAKVDKCHISKIPKDVLTSVKTIGLSNVTARLGEVFCRSPLQLVSLDFVGLMTEHLCPFQIMEFITEEPKKISQPRLPPNKLQSTVFKSAAQRSRRPVHALTTKMQQDHLRWQQADAQAQAEAKVLAASTVQIAEPKLTDQQRLERAGVRPKVSMKVCHCGKGTHIHTTKVTRSLWIPIRYIQCSGVTTDTGSYFPLFLPILGFVWRPHQEDRWP